MTLKQRCVNFIVFIYALMLKFALAFAQKIKLISLYQRRDVIRFLAEPDLIQKKRPRVVVAIAHITSEEEAGNCEKGATKIERLKNTIDGLLASLAHCDLQILVCTVPNRHVTRYLPNYQLDCICVREEIDCDPLYIGFKAQDELAERVNDHDWFIFIEDDIVIHDSFLLEKIAKFNRVYGHETALLFPNRYEMYQGRKSYIDLTIDGGLAWDRVSRFEIGGIKFSECTNPHAGIYCLSQSQMRHWIASGRAWKNRSVMVGPLESAATFCLLECFSIFKPHPANLNYLEVRHYDTKYSKLYPTDSPYILSAVSPEAV